MPSGLILRPAGVSDAAALLAFEQANRQHFERWVQPRGDDFYQLPRVQQHLQQLHGEWQQQRGFHYLAWLDGNLVGRFNLRNVSRPYFNKATLGYRLAASVQGRGLATAAAVQLRRLAFEQHRLSRLEATVRPDNIASRRVLEKSGFRQYGHATRCLLLNGVWHDQLLFECHADSA